MFRGETSEVNTPSLELDPLSRRLTAFHIPNESAIGSAKLNNQQLLETAAIAMNLDPDDLRRAVEASDKIIDKAVDSHLNAQGTVLRTVREYTQGGKTNVNTPGFDVLAEEASLRPEEFVEILKRELNTKRLEARQAVLDSNQVLDEIHPALAAEHVFEE